MINFNTSTLISLDLNHYNQIHVIFTLQVQANCYIKIVLCHWYIFKIGWFFLSKYLIKISFIELITAILYKWQHSVFETENKNTMYCIKFKIINLHSLQQCCSLSYMWGLEILLTCGKHLHDHIISLRGEVWAHKNNLAQPLFIDMHYQLVCQLLMWY